jgi:hypothetical protein
MPGKEKKNAGVWQPVPPDRPAAAKKEWRWAQCCQLLAELSGQTSGKYGSKSGLFQILTFCIATGLKKKSYLCL